jgi:hypothetical protein
MKYSGTTVSGGMSVSCGMRMTTATATCANDDKINSPGIFDWLLCVCVCVCVCVCGARGRASYIHVIAQQDGFVSGTRAQAAHQNLRCLSEVQLEF